MLKLFVLGSSCSIRTTACHADYSAHSHGFDLGVPANGGVFWATCVQRWSAVHDSTSVQVLATLGCVTGLKVLELGAGIGRFTGQLAKTGGELQMGAQHVTRSSSAAG
jgi:hypothetical protein